MPDWRGEHHDRRDLSTVAEHAGGPTRSSVEAPVMGEERRGRVVRRYCLADQLVRLGGIIWTN